MERHWNIRVPAALHQAASEAAAKLGLKDAEYIRRAVQEKTERDGRRAMTDTQLRSRYSDSPWRDPVRMIIAGALDWGCRYCLSRYGVTELPIMEGPSRYGFSDYAEAVTHMQELHE